MRTIEEVVDILASDLSDAKWKNISLEYVPYGKLLSEILEIHKAEQRPKGKWIKCKSRFGTEYFKCSECGRKLNWIDSDDNYCNSCGSDNSESTKELYKAKLAEIIGGREDDINN